MIEVQNENYCFILLTQWILSSFLFVLLLSLLTILPFLIRSRTGWVVHKDGFINWCENWDNMIKSQKSSHSRLQTSLLHTSGASTRSPFSEAGCRGFGENFSWSRCARSYWRLPHFDFKMQCGQSCGQSVAAKVPTGKARLYHIVKHQEAENKIKQGQQPSWPEAAATGNRLVTIVDHCKLIEAQLSCRIWTDSDSERMVLKQNATTLHLEPNVFLCCIVWSGGDEISI